MIGDGTIASRNCNKGKDTETLLARWSTRQENGSSSCLPPRVASHGAALEALPQKGSSECQPEARFTDRMLVPFPTDLSINPQSGCKGEA